MAVIKTKEYQPMPPSMPSMSPPPQKAKAGNAPPTRSKGQSVQSAVIDDLKMMLTPASEIYLELAFDILKLHQKIRASEQRLLECGEPPRFASEVTDPIEDLDTAFNKAWETFGVSLATSAIRTKKEKP